MLTFLTKNPWTFINSNKEWANNKEIRTMAADIYQLIYPIGMGLIVFSIVILFLKWGTKNYRNHGMGRRLSLVAPLLFKLCLVVALACLPYLIGEVWRIMNAIAVAMTS